MTASGRAIGPPVGFSEHGFGETNKAVLAEGCGPLHSRFLPELHNRAAVLVTVLLLRKQ
jgi:hypothetical protein